MARTFFRKKFSNYLGEQRAIDDIVLFFTSDLVPSPTPTPSITPSNTPTPSITPSSTPIISVTTTPTPTQTNTPTTTTTLTATPTLTPTQTPTSSGLACDFTYFVNGTPTPTITSTPTSTPSVVSVDTYSLASGSTIGNSICGTFTNYYGPTSQGGSPNTGEYIYLNTGLSDPAPNGYYYWYNSGLTRYDMFIVSGGVGQITGRANNVGTCDTDVNDYVNAVIGAGGTISDTQYLALNTLVGSMKSQGIWSLIDAAYPFLGGTLGGAKFNLKDPQDTDGAYRMSFNGSWTIDASGATPTSKSSSNYGDSHWSPYGISGNRNDSHHNYRYINGVYNVGCDYAGVASPYTMMGACSQLEWFDGGGALSTGGVVAGTAGYSQGISRTASNVCRFSRKLEGGSWSNFGLINTVATQSSNSMYIGAINGANFPEQMRYGFLTYGQGLTDAQLLNLDSIVTTFATTINRDF